jgi:nitroreductase / dihydropteridine reductase
MTIIENLNWRYATKKMNGEKISDEKIQYILEAARLAPTSSGLQGFEVLVITNKELLEQILPIAFNQNQIVECSHLLVFAAWENYTEAKIRESFDRINSQRGLPLNTTDAYIEKILGMYLPRDLQVNFEHLARQTYISMAAALIAAAEQKVDATPMEGFNPAALDELLNLKEKGLKSTVIVPLGYRDSENDWLVNLKKVRKSTEELFDFIN